MTNEEKLRDYRDKLAAMDDAELLSATEQMVWLSAYASNNGRSIYHAQCDATHDEARRRQKPWLYQRGWNAAYRSCGYEPSDSDVERERPSAWPASGDRSGEADETSTKIEGSAEGESAVTPKAADAHPSCEGPSS